MGSPTLRDMIHAYTFPGGSRRLCCELLKAHLIAQGFDLDATAEEVADGRAWRRLTGKSEEDGCEAVHTPWFPPGERVTARCDRGVHAPTLAAAVAALEEGAGDE